MAGTTLSYHHQTNLSLAKATTIPAPTIRPATLTPTITTLMAMAATTTETTGPVETAEFPA